MSQSEKATSLNSSLSSLYVAPEEEHAPRRAYLLMATRLCVATLLLGGALTIALDQNRGFSSYTPRFLMALIAAMYGTTLVFGIWQLYSERKDLPALGQIAFDLILTTALVYVTGGASSAFTFLYGVAVLMAAMAVGPVQAGVIGALALIFYAGLCLSLAAHWVAPPPDQSDEAYFLPPAELARAALVNVFGLLLVMGLAGTLAARLRAAGGRLKLAEASAAYLARLNEDIVRSLGSGLLTTDQNGRIQTVNPTGVAMFGAQDEKSLVGREIDAFFPSLTPEAANLARAESVAVRLDGKEFPVGYSVSPLISMDGEINGTVVVFQDLTEIALLRETAKKAEQLAMLGSLSAGLAHEIRNPLGSISGCLELVRESQRLDEQDRRLLSIILSEAERLNDLVTTMLLVGKPVVPQRGSEDLRRLVGEVVEMVSRRPAGLHSINVEASIPPEPVVAWVDGDQIRQVLWNLIKNATQSSPEGTTIRIAIKNSDSEHAILEVSDEGVGIEPAQRDRIFDMFYSERTHGAGIGLALVRQIIDAHGGSIDVVSSPQSGATFRVVLPAHEPGDTEHN